MSLSLSRSSFAIVYCIHFSFFLSFGRTFFVLFFFFFDSFSQFASTKVVSLYIPLAHRVCVFVAPNLFGSPCRRWVCLICWVRTWNPSILLSTDGFSFHFFSVCCCPCTPFTSTPPSPVAACSYCVRVPGPSFYFHLFFFRTFCINCNAKTIQFIFKVLYILFCFDENNNATGRSPYIVRLKGWTTRRQ